MLTTETYHVARGPQHVATIVSAIVFGGAFVTVYQPDPHLGATSRTYHATDSGDSSELAEHLADLFSGHSTINSGHDATSLASDIVLCAHDHGGRRPPRELYLPVTT